MCAVDVSMKDPIALGPWEDGKALLLSQRLRLRGWQSLALVLVWMSNMCVECVLHLFIPRPRCLHDPAAYVTPASPSIHLLFLAAQLFIVNTLSFLVAASFHQSPVQPMPFSLCMVVCFHSHAYSGQLPGAMHGLDRESFTRKAVVGTGQKSTFKISSSLHNYWVIAWGLIHCHSC